MNFQQHLMRRTWKPRKEIEISMIIKGKIINSVRLNDIGKSIDLGQEISLNEYEVNKSKDLQNAINRDWVEIIYDRGMLKRAQVAGIQQKSSDVEILDMAKKMAQTMAEEMIKNSQLVKEIAKELAKEMVLEIKDNLKIEHVSQQVAQEKFKSDSPDNIFVEFKDDESGITANINNARTVEVQKDDLTGSLEKMKMFRKKGKK